MEQDILMRVETWLKEGKKNEFVSFADELQPYDLAQLFEKLSEKHQTRFLLYLPLEQISLLLGELPKETQFVLLNKLGIEKTGKVMDLMDNDDVASLLEEIDPEKVEEYLSGMDDEESTIVRDMMNYPAETAGRLMTDRFVWIYKDYTVRKAVNKLKEFAEYTEIINYLYVIDDKRKIAGVVSYRDLLLADIEESIENIMYHRVLSVNVQTDQEEVAKMIERYDFAAIPVVDDEEKLVGIVTVDDMLDVVIQEANEDIEKMAATGKTIDFHTNALVAAFRRIPWLILLLFIGLVSGNIISRFEHTLHSVVALTYFMPMIAGMTGNIGTQSLAVVVRGLVSHDLTAKTISKLIGREFGVSLIIGTICGVLIAIVAYVWQGNPILGFVVGGSLFLTLIIGTLAGTIIPIILYKCKVDPAIASGPLITTLNDIFSLIVYFGIATIFLSKLM